MNYQVLARKWRPQTFNDVVGQEHVLTALTNSLSLRRVHHAYLFSGASGVGKTSIARLLAKGLNCSTGITAMPCGICNSCQEITQGRFIDLIEIDAASRTKVDDTRDLLENIQYTPTHARFKIYLIDEVHMLSRYSLNALLKTLEEPPTHVKFLLATTDPQKLSVTVLSRCLHFHLKALDVKQICIQLKNILKFENVMYEFCALKLLANAANGSLRDALSLTDQAIASSCNGKLTAENVSAMLGTLNDKHALSLIEAIINADGEQTMSLINEAASWGVEWEVLLIEMLTLLHRLAMLQLSSLNSDEDVDTMTIENRLLKLARIVPPSEVQLYYQTILIGRKELPYAPSKRMGVEMTLLRALAFHPKNLFIKKKKKTHCQQLPCTPNIPAVMTADMLQIKMQTATNILLPKSDNTSNSLNDLFCNKELIPLTHERKIISTNIQQKHKEINVLKRLNLITSTTQKCMPKHMHKLRVLNKEDCCHFFKRNIAIEKFENESVIITPRKKQLLINMQKNLNFQKKVTKCVIASDSWAAEISRLQLPKLVKQVALNTWKEQNGDQIRLHIRPNGNKQLLDFSYVHKVLTEELAILHGTQVELIFIEDNNPQKCTPLEWRQVIYNKKLKQAHKEIMLDNNVKILCQLFDAILDENSIHPL